MKLDTVYCIVLVVLRLHKQFLDRHLVISGEQNMQVDFFCIVCALDVARIHRKLICVIMWWSPVIMQCNTMWLSCDSHVTYPQLTVEVGAVGVTATNLEQNIIFHSYRKPVSTPILLCQLHVSNGGRSHHKALWSQQQGKFVCSMRLTSNPIQKLRGGE